MCLEKPSGFIGLYFANSMAEHNQLNTVQPQNLILEKATPGPNS